MTIIDRYIISQLCYFEFVCVSLSAIVLVAFVIKDLE